MKDEVKAALNANCNEANSSLESSWSFLAVFVNQYFNWVE